MTAEMEPAVTIQYSYTARNPAVDLFIEYSSLRWKTVGFKAVVLISARRFYRRSQRIEFVFDQLLWSVLSVKEDIY